jgi:hypothetical protein
VKRLLALLMTAGFFAGHGVLFAEENTAARAVFETPEISTAAVNHTVKKAKKTKKARKAKKTKKEISEESK